jgi:uncharacterized protein YbjQ (UPF0145 family)
MATPAMQGASVDQRLTTTAFDIHGYRVVRNLGVVRGIVVRSRSIFGTIGAGLQTIVGGNITLFTNLCEQTRAQAFELMIQHASELGANAVIGVRYDATEIMNGVTEVLAYGTAVVVEKVGARSVWRGCGRCFQKTEICASVSRAGEYAREPSVAQDGNLV